MVTALEFTVMLLLNTPTIVVLYFTFILLEAPGAIGTRGQSGTVHPHEAFTLLRIKWNLTSVGKPEFAISISAMHHCCHSHEWFLSNTN
ncbi:MAG: hypothetical protein MZV64_20740 [Ignavibacteriales bacterium]|nr:hypothetical protein [Ignavibacteriales bacterium]